MKEKCEACRWWSNYTNRVFARVYGVTTDRAGDLVELRPCRYSPAPQINTTMHQVYTDENFVCSEFQKETV